ncbi:MAG: hypothetical protein ABSC53_15525 [Bacteroidota bacterium]
MTKNVHPSKQAFDSPTFSITTQWSAVLDFRSDSIYIDEEKVLRYHLVEVHDQANQSHTLDYR